MLCDESVEKKKKKDRRHEQLNWVPPGAAGIEIRERELRCRRGQPPLYAKRSWLSIPWYLGSTEETHPILHQRAEDPKLHLLECHHLSWPSSRGFRKNIVNKKLLVTLYRSTILSYCITAWFFSHGSGCGGCPLLSLNDIYVMLPQQSDHHHQWIYLNYIYGIHI